jgi:hypothetical protein
MVRKWLLQTRNARAIVRKAGLRAGSGEFVGYPENLWAQGWMWNTSITTPWSLDAFSRPGVWGLWPTRTWILKPYAVPGQYVYADLRGVAFARVVVSISAGTGAPTVAWVPVYSATLNPMETGGDTPQALGRWYVPGGMSLLDYDEDIRPGGPRVLEWPPKGSCQPLPVAPGQPPGPTGQLRGCHAGTWAAPPREALGTDEVVCATAVIANPTEAELAVPGGYIIRAQVQLQSVAEDSEAWRTYFTDEIDE